MIDTPGEAYILCSKRSWILTGPVSWSCREDDILVARHCTLGAVFGLTALAVLGGMPFAAAEASQSGWGSNITQAKRTYFRPWGPIERRAAPALRWRPQAAAYGHRLMPPRALTGTPRGMPSTGMPLTPTTAPLIVTEEPRYITESSPADVRFRPRERRGSGRSANGVNGLSLGGNHEQDRLHAQFRPRRPAKRLRYEELQASRGGAWQYPGRHVGGAKHAFPVTAYAQPWPAW